MSTLSIALICVAAAVVLAGLVAAFVIFSNNCIQITHHKFFDGRVPEEGVRIVHLSDLHGKSFGRNNARLIEKVSSQSPAFIAVTGDIIHKYREKDIAVALQTVAELVKIAPVYYVSGNHEMRSTAYRAFKERLVSAGAVVLDDSTAIQSGVELAGVNCSHIKSGKFFFESEGGRYRILLAHLPQYLNRYALAGYDLVLCGHAHGGQWRIPFTKIGVYAPGQGLFPKYSEGRHTCGDTCEVISRGLGNSECPLRLFNRPEIVVIDLVKYDN